MPDPATAACAAALLALACVCHARVWRPPLPRWARAGAALATVGAGALAAWGAAALAPWFGAPPR